MEIFNFKTGAGVLVVENSFYSTWVLLVVLDSQFYFFCLQLAVKMLRFELGLLFLNCLLSCE